MLPSRRDLVNLAVHAAALPGGAAFVSAWLEAADEHRHAPGANAPPEPPLLRNYKPRFFAADDFEALEAFTEILIPRDDTPGATDARCAHFIDFLLDSATDSAPEMQKQWREAMARLREAGFHAADAPGRAKLVEEISRH